MLSSFDILGAVLAAATLGQACLTASLLAVRKDPRGIYLPLFIFFCANAIAELSGIAEVFANTRETLSVRHVIDLSSILAFTLIPPSIWLYVRALTSEEPSRFNMKDAWHLLAFGIGLVVSLLLLVSPFDVRHQIIGDGDGEDTSQVFFLTLAMLTLMLTWIAQTAIYVLKILFRLTRYRSRLKDLFASTEGRELNWISWVVTLLAINFFIVVMDMFFAVSPAISTVSDTFDFAMVWILSLWGLRVTPFLESESGSTADPGTDGGALMKPSPSKYEKSALTAEHIQRISEKLNRIMEQDQLYLEPSLSLRDLAKAISTQPNR